VVSASLTLMLAFGLTMKLRHVAPIVEGPVQPRLTCEVAAIHAPIGSAGTMAHLAFSLGADGPALAMVLLTSVVTLSVLLVTPRLIAEKLSDYAAFLLFTEGCLIGTFLAMDLFLFYTFFELTLLPAWILLGGWGSDRSLAAARRFVIYTLAGSLPMAVAFLGMAIHDPAAPTLSIPELATQASTAAGGIPAAAQSWIFALLVLGFGIKMALLPVHTWLPSTYEAAHPTTAALLAGVVLKLGLVGFLRIALPLVPHACAEYATPTLSLLGAVAVVYGALAALAQRDLRLILAYSSLSHCGFITIGLFALNVQGITGATLQMVNHGLTTSATFLLLGMIAYRRRSMNLDTGVTGLATLFPRLTAMIVFFLLAGAGLPGLNNFVGELLALAGMMAVSPWIAAVAALGIILGAWYALRLTQLLLFGKPEESAITTIRDRSDLNAREFFCLAPLMALCLFIGIAPQPAIALIEPDCEAIVSLYSRLGEKDDPSIVQRDQSITP
jgi:NADH-quinone oxidoreductase subunit M